MTNPWLDRSLSLLSSMERSRWMARGALCAVVGLLAGCRTNALSAGGARVATAQSAPVDYGYQPGQCTSLGFLVGRGGGSFGGGLLTNESLVDYAMNDLRNQAASKGANFIQHDTPQLGVSGGKDGVSTTTATVSGTAYRCSGDSPAPSKYEGELPAGMAGFRFGVPASVAAKQCTDAGFSWTADADKGTCSGQPSPVGVNGSAEVHLCDGQVCAVDVLSNSADDEALSSYRQIDKALVARYSKPRGGAAPLPAECEASALKCVAEGRGELRRTWKWSTGHFIDLMMTRADGGMKTRLVYGNPTWGRRIAKGPAL